MTKFEFMDVVKIYSIRDYCLGLKNIIEKHDENEISVNVYGSGKQKLKDIIEEPNTDNNIFYLKIADLGGSISRILSGSFKNVPLYDWIGGQESFTRDNFISEIREIWDDL